MIEKDIEEHVEPKIKTNEEVEVNRICTKDHTFSSPRNIGYNGSRIRGKDERKNLSHQTHRIMKNIPWIKAKKTTEIDSKYRQNHHNCDENPSFHMMVFFVPIIMKQFEGSESGDKTSECWGCNQDNIKVNILRKFPEVNKVGKDIERIREEKKPKKEENGMEKSFFLHGHHREKIWNQSEDEIPNKSSEDQISRKIGPKQGKESSIETENGIGM